MPQDTSSPYNTPRLPHNEDILGDYIRSSATRRRPVSSIETFARLLDLSARNPSEAAKEMAYIIFDLEPLFREWIQRKLPIKFPPEFEQLSSQLQDVRHQALQDAENDQNYNPHPRQAFHEPHMLQGAGSRQSRKPRLDTEYRNHYG